MPTSNPNLQVLVNGVDLSAYVDQDRWQIVQNWGRQGSTANFYLYDEFTSPAARHYTPQPLQVIQFNHVTAGQTIFQGLVTNPQFKYISPNACEWYLDCRDFTYFADLAVVTGDFTYQSAGSIIKTLTAQAGVGITTNHVQAGIIVPRYRINYKSLSSVWTHLATLSSGVTPTSGIAAYQSQYGWYVDPSLDLHWYDASQVALDPTISSGVTFTDQLVAGDAAGGTATRGFMTADANFKYEFDGQNLRNSCLVRGSNIQLSQTDTFVGNGSQSSWPLTFSVLKTNPSFSLKIAPYVGYPGTSFSLQDITKVQQTGSDPFFIANQNNSGQWFFYVNTANPIHFIPAPGDIMTVKYTYEAPIVARVDDTVGQASLRRQLAAAGVTQAKGIFEQYIADKNIKDHGTAQQRANREVAEYGQSQERITFTTTDDFPGVIQAGQIFTLNSQFIPNSLNNYVSGLTGNFLAQKVLIKPSQKKANFLTFQIMGVRIS